jgi:hypothetical protein
MSDFGAVDLPVVDRASAKPSSKVGKLCRQSLIVLTGLLSAASSKAWADDHPLTLALPSGAQISFIGAVDYSLGTYNHVSNATNTGSSGSQTFLQSGWNSVDNFGFKGFQPLDQFFGHHVSFVFDFQAGFDLVNFKELNDKVFFTRNAFVGFSSDFGTLTEGRQWNFNDDYIIGNYVAGAYQGSVFRLTEFGELSDIHDNTIKYVTPLLFGADPTRGVQAGVYYQFRGDIGGPPGYNIFEAMARYAAGPVTATATYDRQTDAVGNVLSSMPTFGANYTIGHLRLRAAAAFNSLRPGVSAYPGGVGPISVPVPTQVNLYSVGADYALTAKWTVSGEIDYRDDLTRDNNTQIFRLSTDYTINQFIDVYSQLVYEMNHGGAAESLYSLGDATYLGSGFPNQTQLAFVNGIRVRF